MSMMRVLHNLVNHSHGSPDDKCLLLVEVTKTNLEVETHRIECQRSEIEGVCHRFRDEDNTFEVTVYQRIYHAKKEPVPVSADNTDAALLATAAMGAMKF